MERFDRQCVEERQLRHSASQAVGVPVVCRCRHGFPQAVLFEPMGKNKPVSGLIRLTCPHLVKAIDEYEAEGAVKEFNKRLQGNQLWKESLQRTNDVHRELRRGLVGPSDHAALAERFGAAQAQAFLDAGLAGMSPTKNNDVKCLHAQLGDWMFHDQNVIGKAVVQDLADRGVPIDGCEDCSQQCDVNREETDSTWKYVAQKNRSKLRQKVSRRKLQKQQEKAKSAAPLPAGE